jgi:hypothetical protein
VLQIENDEGDPSFVPACLFRIEDPRCSGYWQIREESDGAVHLWPPSFFTDYYHEDLSEDVADVVDDYNKVLSLLRSEHDA